MKSRAILSDTTELLRFGHIGYCSRDVTDQAGMVAEAREVAEEGLLSKADFKAFTLGNIAELHSQMNLGFFENAVVESEVRRHLRPRNSRRKAA